MKQELRMKIIYKKQNVSKQQTNIINSNMEVMIIFKDFKLPL